MLNRFRVMLAALVAAFVVCGCSRPFEERFEIINGPEYDQVGRNVFDSYADHGDCLKLWSKRYARERVIVHGCEL